MLVLTMMMSPGYKVVWISPWQDIQHSGGERSFQVLTPLNCTWVRRGQTSVDLRNLHLPTGEVNIIHVKVGPRTWSTCMGSLDEQFESLATLLVKLALLSHQEFLTYEDPRLLWWCWFWVKERGPLKNRLRLVYQRYTESPIIGDSDDTWTLALYWIWSTSSINC